MRNQLQSKFYMILKSTHKFYDTSTNTVRLK
jgi:hypothetical protein